MHMFRIVTDAFIYGDCQDQKQTLVAVGKVKIIRSKLDKQMFFFWWLGNCLVCFLFFLHYYYYYEYYYLNKVTYSEAAQQVMLQVTNSTNRTVWQFFVRVVYIDHNIEKHKINKLKLHRHIEQKCIFDINDSILCFFFQGLYEHKMHSSFANINK